MKQQISIILFALAVGIESLNGQSSLIRTNGLVLATSNGKEYVASSNKLNKLANPDQPKKQAAEIADWILGIRIAQIASEMRITVTDMDQKSYLANAHGNLDSSVQRLQQIMEHLPLALREALREPEREEIIYKKHLEGLMSRELWKGHLSSCNNEEKIRKLEAAPKATTNDLIKPNPAICSMLLRKKLRERITSDVSVSQEDIMQTYSKLQSTNTLEQMRPMLTASITKAKRERMWEKWLSNQLKAAPVVIYDATVKEAYKSIVESDERVTIEVPQNKH